MGRRKKIEDADILKEARAEFLQKGAFGSTKDIAGRCGVSEATLFLRFPTKAKLFIAALAPPEVDVQDIIFAPTKSDNPKAELTEVCHRILDYFRALIPTAIHLMTHPGISMDDVTQHFKPAASGSLNNALAEYLRGADRLGEMSVPDPVASAGLLISALHSLPLFEMMKFHGGADLSHAVEKFVDAQWQGFRPEMIHQPGSRKGKSK